jgi:hypothetical protein
VVAVCSTPLQLRRLIREVRRAPPAVPQGPGGRAVGPRCPPDPQIDPSRVHGLEHAELLCNGERRVVREHHSARTDSDS